MRNLLYSFIVMIAWPACAQVWDVTCPPGTVPQHISVSAPGHLKANDCVDSTGKVTATSAFSVSTALPSGIIFLRLSGTCPAGSTEVSALNGKMLRGTVAANGDVGTTGGNATITPTGTVSQPTLTMDAITSVINHTHTVSVTDPGHTHTTASTSFTEQSQGSTTASTSGTHVMTSTATGGSIRSVESTVAKTVTINSATTGISATTANPVGGVSSITPTGAISQPTFTGDAIDPSPAYIKVIFCSAN